MAIPAGFVADEEQETRSPSVPDGFVADQGPTRLSAVELSPLLEAEERLKTRPRYNLPKPAPIGEPVAGPFGPSRDTTLTQAIYGPLVAAEDATIRGLGAGLDFAGKAVKSAAVAPFFTFIGEPELAAQEALSPLGLQGIVPGGEPDTGESPYTAGQRMLPTVLGAPSRAATGLLETAPRLAASAALPAATPLIWGATPEGLDVKQAAIATLLPVVGKWTGFATEAVAKAFGLESEQAAGLLNRLGGGLGAAGVVGVDEMRRIHNLPPEEQKDAWVDAVMNTVNMAGLGMLGHGKRVPAKPTFERARTAGEMLSQIPGATGSIFQSERFVAPQRERAPKPTVPEFGTPETAREGMTIPEEIRQAGARTIRDIQAIWPEATISREQAREWGKQAWGQWPPPDTEGARQAPPEEPPAAAALTEPAPKPTPQAGPTAAELSERLAKRDDTADQERAKSAASGFLARQRAQQTAASLGLNWKETGVIKPETMAGLTPEQQAQLKTIQAENQWEFTDPKTGLTFYTKAGATPEEIRAASEAKLAEQRPSAPSEKPATKGPALPTVPTKSASEAKRLGVIIEPIWKGIYDKSPAFRVSAAGKPGVSEVTTGSTAKELTSLIRAIAERSGQAKMDAGKLVPGTSAKDWIEKQRAKLQQEIDDRLAGKPPKEGPKDASGIRTHEGPVPRPGDEPAGGEVKGRQDLEQPTPQQPSGATPQAPPPLPTKVPSLATGEKLIDLPSTDLPLSAQRARLVKMLETLEEVDPKTGEPIAKEGKEESGYIVRERLHHVERQLAGLPPKPYQEPPPTVKRAREERAESKRRAETDANEWIGDAVDSAEPPTSEAEAWKQYTEWAGDAENHTTREHFTENWNKAVADRKKYLEEGGAEVEPISPAPKEGATLEQLLDDQTPNKSVFDHLARFAAGIKNLVELKAPLMAALEKERTRTPSSKAARIARQKREAALNEQMRPIEDRLVALERQRNTLRTLHQVEAYDWDTYIRDGKPLPPEREQNYTAPKATGKPPPAPTPTPTVTKPPTAKSLTPLDRKIQDAEGAIWSIQGLEPGFLDKLRDEAKSRGWSDERYLQALEDAVGKRTAINVPILPERPELAAPPPPPKPETAKPAPTVNEIQAQRTKVQNLERKLKKMTAMVPPPIRQETANYLAEQQAKLDEMVKAFRSESETPSPAPAAPTAPPPPQKPTPAPAPAPTAAPQAAAPETKAKDFGAVVDRAVMRGTLEELRRKRDLWTDKLEQLNARLAIAETARDKLEHLSMGDPKWQDANARVTQLRRNIAKMEQAIRQAGSDISWLRYQEQVSPFRGAAAQAKVGKGTKTITSKTLKAQQEHLLDELSKAIKEAPEEFKEGNKITISVPGDGEFTLQNDKETLKRFRDTVKSQFPTSVPGERGPEKTKKGSTIPKVETPETGEEAAKVAGMFTADDKSRFVLLSSYADGTQIVATDGRRLMRIITPQAPGRPDAPVRLTPEGKVDPEAEGKYPNWQQVRNPNPTLVYGGAPTADIWKLAKQGEIFRNTTFPDRSKRDTAKGLTLYVNPDRSIGARMEAEGDVFEHNLQEGRLDLGSYDVDYLLDAMTAARKLGNERVDLYTHGDEGPIGFVGQNHELLLMPRREGATIRDPSAQFAGVAGGREHLLPPEGYGPLENPRDAITESSKLAKSILQTTLEGDTITFSEVHEVKEAGYAGLGSTRQETKTLGSISVEDWKTAGTAKRLGLISDALGPEKGSPGMAKLLAKDVALAFEERTRLEKLAEERKQAAAKLPPGPGAQTAGEDPYPAIQQLSDQLDAAPAESGKEALDVRQKVVDKWAEGKSAGQRAIGSLLAIGSSIKETLRGVRPQTGLDNLIGQLDWLLQRSSAQSRESGKTMRRQVPNDTVRRAAALWIDTPGDAARKQRILNDALSRLPAETRPEIRRAVELAAQGTPEVQNFASQLQQYYGIREQDAIVNGIFGEMDAKGNILQGGLANYFTHVWGPDPANWPDSFRAAVNSGRGRVQTYFKYGQKRTIGMFLEGIMAGKHPELDPAKVVPHYNFQLDRAIASRLFIKRMADEVTASDGRAALAPTGNAKMETDPTGAVESITINPKGRTDDLTGYVNIDHPSMRKWRWMINDENGNPIFAQTDLVVHPEFAKRLGRFMDKKILTPTEWGRKALRLSTEVKGFKLGLLSFFHQVHVGTHALWHWTLPFDFADPNYFTRDGKINWDAPAVRYAVEKGHLKLAANPEELSVFAEGILSPGLVHKIPVFGPWSRAYAEFVFGDLIPKLKLKTFANAMPRNQRWYGGKLSPDEIAARVGDSVNNAYGELNHLFLGKAGRDPRFQRLLRGIFLAPDFGEARLRFVEKAFTKTGNEERLALGTMFLTLYFGARIANWLSHGDPESNDMKRAFQVKVGDKWYSMRSVVGDLDHAITDSGRFFYVRLNPLYSRTAADWLLGRDPGTGRKLSAWEKFVTRPRDQLVPIQFQGLTRDDQSLWDSFITSAGLSSQRVSVQQDVSEKARNWMKHSTDPKAREEFERREQEVFPVSLYRKLRLAMRDENPETIRSEIRGLLAKEPTQKDKVKRVHEILDQFNPRTKSGSLKPFATHSREFEAEFVKSLDERGRQEYRDALRQQEKEYRLIRQVIGLK